ncbi:MAG TPA: MAPEG family protein [Gammaproteobacteria bacterium]
MHAPVTALYAGLLALLLIALAARIPLLRQKHRVGIGSGKQPDLALAMRVHGNATEYVPIALLLLLLAELNGFPAWSVHAAGSGLFLGRILHAFGLGRSAGASPGRFIGTALTWLVIVTLAASLIFNVLT